MAVAMKVAAVAFLLLCLAIMISLFIVHVWAIMESDVEEEAEELAEEIAEEKFNDYVKHCEYRVHITQRIVDEMKRR